jgi:hypothetical protein
MSLGRTTALFAIFALPLVASAQRPNDSPLPYYCKFAEDTQHELDKAERDGKRRRSGERVGSMDAVRPGHALARGELCYGGFVRVRAVIHGETVWVRQLEDGAHVQCSENPSQRLKARK